MDSIKNISLFLEKQFPDFYAEEGPEFIQFVKDYYEWMEVSGNTINKTRSLFEYGDVDTTTEALLEHFRKKYMVSISEDIVTNKRLLIKHINEVYRSKGSIEGLKLLFRLVYQESIEIYLPGKDMLSVSDGKWKIPLYIEIDLIEVDPSFINARIIGSVSGASAFVERFESIYLGNFRANILLISNIIGDFLVNETIYYEGIDPLISKPTIKGSVVEVSITTSTSNNVVGDLLTPVSSNGISAELKVAVASIRETVFNNGSLEFTIVDGGDGYTLTSNVSISYGSANTGSGANFDIGSLSNIRYFNYNTNIIGDSANTIVGANNYGINLNFANSASILTSALTFGNVAIGSIATLTNINPGLNYNGNVIITIDNPLIRHYYEFQEADDAIINGDLASGNGYVNSTYVVSSGFNYKAISENLLFVNLNNPANSILAKPILGSIGKASGYWSGTDGFLNSDKFVQDSFYYQKYAYEIRAKKTLSEYMKILYSLGHPAGNELFGAISIGGEFTEINRSYEYERTTI